MPAITKRNALFVVAAGLFYGLYRASRRWKRMTAFERMQFMRGVRNVRRIHLFTALNILRWAFSRRGGRHFVALVREKFGKCGGPVERCHGPTPIALECDLRDCIFPLPGSEIVHTGPLKVNPTFVLARSHARCPHAVRLRTMPLNDRIRTRVQSNDYIGSDVAWVELPGVHFYLPYLVPECFLEALEGLESGTLKPDDVEETLKQALVAAGILTSDDFLEAEEAKWSRILEVKREQLRTRGYTIFEESLLPPHMFQALRLHLAQIHSTKFFLTRTASGGMYRWNEPVSSFVNFQFADLIQRVVDEPILPDQPITHWYEGGGMLGLHFDGPPYAFSFSYIVDEVRMDDQPPLPISLISKDLRNPVIDVYLKAGQAVLFKGGEHPHYRDPHPGQTCTSLSMSFDRVAF